jgi:type IV secretory pathway VirB3-like protein
MIDALLRLFALRPLFTAAILGIPLLLLVVVGLFTILALKFLIFVVLPIAVIVWVARKLFWRRDCEGPEEWQ